MNLLLEALLNSAMLSAALTAIVWLALRVAPARALNAATRYAVWWIALAVTVLLPLAWAPMPAGSVPPIRTAAPPAFEPAPPAPLVLHSPPAIETLDTTRASTPSISVPAPSPVFPVRVSAGPWIVWLLAALGLASAWMLVRLLVSYALLLRRRAGAAQAPAHLRARAGVWLSRCGSARSGVALAISHDIASPVAVGPYRPAILLPAGFVEGLEETELDQIGLHEAAHLARRDDVALLIQRALEAVFAWHPVVRWIGRRLDLEREIACDDFVVAATGSPKPYAVCLARLAEMAGSAPAPLAAPASHTGDLVRRVEMLLDRRRHHGARVLRFRVAVALAAQLALALAVAQLPGPVAFATPFAAPPPQAAPPAPTSQTVTVPIAVATDPVHGWLVQNAVRLKTAEARNGFADMQPLRKMIGNARIVSLGEATHGTREFFQLKHRMMEFLATEMGFTIFSIEANMPEAYRLNDYVLEGKGDPAALLAGMYFWTWNTEEVLDMIRWMREFNQSGKGRVQFTGFDMQYPDVAIANVRAFVEKCDGDYSGTLGNATRLAGEARPPQRPQTRFGYATGTFPVEAAAGKHVRFSGWIRTENVTDGYAGLWWRVDGPDRKMLAFRNLGEDAPKGTTRWKRYSLELDVARDATNINFGALSSGGGSAWFDGFAVELDGKIYKSDQFEFDFEGLEVKGFFTGGSPWSVRLDRDAVHSGAQSLLIRRDGPAPPPAAAAPANDGSGAKAAVKAWKEVVAHLDASREAYRAQKAAAREIEWAVQNARVVLQCMQGRAREVSRDRSMAENVKWILDQNPRAKIVLWAHNGHVGTGGYRGYEPMGVDLRRMYGDQMFVFGFAFNRGSFQAVEMGRSLHDFTAPPAPPESLDAMFASTGIPIFAVDLRRAPASGPVSAWLAKPQRTRTIGAVYSLANEGQYFGELKPRETFDAMLFVEKTTAARKTTALTLPPPAGSSSIFDERKVSDAVEYRDSQYGIAFSLPAGWQFRNASRWGDRETTAWMLHPDWLPAPAVYYRPIEAPGMASAAAARKRMRDLVADKVQQRLNAGLAGYRIRPSSCRERTVGGRHALSCIADFHQEGEERSEHLTYVVSERFLALFFARAATSKLDSAIANFDRVIDTLQLP